MRFFKMAPGKYGHGDQFIGVAVPDQRKLVRKFRGISRTEILKLLKSKVHEDRHMALLLLVDHYQIHKNDEAMQQLTVDSYLGHLQHINNWDLVDVSAPKILGNWLLTRDRSILFTQAKSPHLWTRRVAMVATQELIRHGEVAEALQLAKVLRDDPEDLIHKAVGWMLREVGQKVGPTSLRKFLRENAAQMPRTMLRYAIEKLPSEERKRWMSAK